MIGNDVIDIKKTKLESNWERKGFLDKVFTSSEQEIIHKSNDKFLAVWRMWSMKESAYKLFIQKGNERFYNPLKLVCSIIFNESGVVQIEDYSINTKTIITSDYIYTSAYQLAEKEVVDDVFFMNSNNESMCVYNGLLNYVSLEKNKIRKELEIRKTINGVPEIYENDDRLNLSFSLSHHGSFGAFSILN